jgi:repressor of nif and glnA expression
MCLPSEKDNGSIAVSVKQTSATSKLAVLQALKETAGVAGASRLREKLLARGHDLQPRTVRLYLRQLDEEGLTRLVSRRAGRELTQRGSEELACANIVQKIGFIGSRMDALVYRMTYDLHAKTGTIVANVALIPQGGLVRAMEVIRPVFTSRLGMGTKIAVVPGGEPFGRLHIPTGAIGLATVCSVTANGILLKQGIPVTSRYGGLMELRDRKPVRFTALIDYSGTTLDPLEAFIRAGMTSVRECVRTGGGIIGVSFREIPAAAAVDVRRLKEEMEARGVDGILAIGTPNRPLYDVPVGEGRVGMIVKGGLNPIAALAETQAEVTFQSLAEVEDIARFTDYNAL